MRPGEELLFVRPASGLVRAIGPRTVIFLALAPSLSVYFFSLSPPLLVRFPGISLPIVHALAGLILIMEGAIAAMLMICMPRSGGQYVVISRALGPMWGLMEGYRAVLQNAWSAGIGTYFAAIAIPGTITVMGKILKNPGLMQMGISMSKNIPLVVALGICLIIIIALVDFFGPGLLAR